MPKSRKRKKAQPAPPGKPRGWWARNREGIYQGFGGGFSAGCLPVFAAVLILPIGLFL